MLEQDWWRQCENIRKESSLPNSRSSFNQSTKCSGIRSKSPRLSVVDSGFYGAEQGALRVDDWACRSFSWSHKYQWRLLILWSYQELPHPGFLQEMSSAPQLSCLEFLSSLESFHLPKLLGYVNTNSYCFCWKVFSLKKKRDKSFMQI